MNIFVLDNNPYLAAHYLLDKHVNKMLLESSQMLCSIYQPGSAPYKRSYYNHPCTIWTRSSKQNYEWLLTHAEGIAIEYAFRYRKDHACKKVINWCKTNYHVLSLPDIGLTPFAQAMPDCYKNEDAVKAYRAYYIDAKADIATWTLPSVSPPWWPYKELPHVPLHGIKE